MSRPTSPSVHNSDEASNISETADSSEEWLDATCLEPLVSPEPGYARLCNACKRVFCVHLGDRWANHIQYLDTLVWSSRRDCVLCSMILYRIEGEDLNYRQSPRQNIRYEVGYPFGDKSELGVRFICNGNWLIDLIMLHLGIYLHSYSRRYTQTCVLKDPIYQI